MNVRTLVLLTPQEAERLGAQAQRLKLRPARLARRLYQGRLDRIPAANRELYRELARSTANLTQLASHLESSPTPQPELALQVQLLAEELRQFRRTLLDQAERLDADPACEEAS